MVAKGGGKNVEVVRMGIDFFKHRRLWDERDYRDICHVECYVSWRCDCPD